LYFIFKKKYRIKFLQNTAAKKSKTGKSSIVRNNGGKMAINIVVGLPKISAAPDSEEASGQSDNKSWKENAAKEVEEEEEQQQEMEADIFADDEIQQQQHHK
jgi:hypothetical protein